MGKIDQTALADLRKAISARELDKGLPAKTGGPQSVHVPISLLKQLLDNTEKLTMDWDAFHAGPDLSVRVGQLDMYSYDRPSYTLWDAVARGLMHKGYTQAQAETWLRSKDARWALDGDLGDALKALGFNYGKVQA